MLEKFAVVVDDLTYLFAFYEDYFLVYCPHSDMEDPWIFFMKGCYNIWAAVIRFDGYHFRHSLMKSIPSAGQLGIIVYNDIGEYYGRLIPRFAACLSPYGHVLGVPKTDVILFIWSIYEFPKNNGFIIYISAIIQPIAKISTGAEYAENLNNNSGARYHLVEQYSVNGGLVLISLAIPKSINLILNYWSINKFYGLRSLWKKPTLWM